MTREPITIADYTKIKKVSDVQLSSNYVYFVERSTSHKSNEYTSSIKRFDMENQEIKQFTSGSKTDYHPRISPDGKKLAFLSSRDDKPQVYLMDIEGGEGLAITKAKKGVNGFTWSPDSQKIAFSANWRTEDDNEDDKTDSVEDPRLKAEIDKIQEKYMEEAMNDPQVIDQIVFRTGTSFIDQYRTTQIFVRIIGEDKSTRITNADYSYGAPEWRGGNHVVAYRKNRDTLIHIDHLVEIDTSNSTEETLYENYNPFIFPFKAEVNEYNSQVLMPLMEEEYFPGKLAQITKYAWLNNPSNIVNKQFDRSISSTKFVSQEAAMVIVDTEGWSRIMDWDINSNTFTEFYTPDFSAESHAVSKNLSYVVASGTSPKHPSAIWILTRKEVGETVTEMVYDPNEWLSEREISDPTTHWMTNLDGTKFQYWVFEPREGSYSGNKPPMMLSLHGGPHAMWTNAGSMWHEWQIQAAMGYLVVAPNPVGSDGYGEEFMRVIAGNWGYDDGRDEIQLVQHFIDEGRVDPQKIFTGGGSYAGFQVGHLITTYDIFTAACAQRGVFNLSNLFAGGDISHFGELEYTGDEWEQREKLWVDSPLSKVKNAASPLLIIHSENDYRVPIAQADEFYAGLKKYGKTVKYIRYPRDGHELSRSGEPIHLMDRLSKMMEWFDEYR